MSGMPYQNRTANSQRVVRGASKNRSQCMAEVTSRARNREDRINPAERDYHDVVANIRCVAEKRGNALNMPKPSEYILKRLRCVDGFRVTDNGDGTVKISWAAGK